MANWIEKNLPKPMREKMSTLIITALGLFLALQYNEYIQKLINAIFPAGEGLVNQGIYIVVLTFVIVSLSVWVERSLDGK